jgi:hypothetical protein
MKTYRWIMITVLVLSLGFPAMAASAAAPQQAVRSASITLTSPAPNPVLIGNEITFDGIISAANIVPGVAGYEGYFSFDSALVAPGATPGAIAAEVLPDFFGVSNVSINEVLPAAQCLPSGGANPCIHLVLAGPAQVTQTGVAVRFHFRGIAEGKACFAVLKSEMVDADGYQVVHTTPASPQCVDVQPRIIASGGVSKQGVEASPNPGKGSKACVPVSAIGAATFGPVYTALTGGFKFAVLPAGTYTFRAEYSGYLSSEKTGVSILANAATVDLGSTKLLGGDVNGDKAINILDIGSIIGKFGQTGVAVGSANPANCAARDEAADINISDLAITAGNWGKTGPTAWLP